MTEEGDDVALPAAMAALLEFWEDSSGSASLPHVSKIAPLKLRLWLGTLSLFDVEHDPFRIRIRLQGTRITAAFGQDSTGQYLDEFMPAHALPRIQSDFEWIIKNQQPLHRWGTCHLDNDTKIPFHRLLLPYVDDSGVVSRIMGTLGFTGLRGRTIPYPAFAKAIDTSETRPL